MASWQGKVVLVTGGSSGLGRSIAAAFAERGARVAIAARGREALERTAAELSTGGAEVVPFTADVSRQDSVDALVQNVVAHFGRLDALVNNAGLSGRKAVLDTTPEDFATMMDLNLLGLVRTTRACAPHLLRTGGHVINIGSLAGKSATRYMGAYPASKFAVSAYSQQLRLELAPQGLHVLLVCPGPIARAEPRSAARAGEDELDLPASARRPGAGVKVRLLQPEDLARRIVEACEKRKPELIVPAKARLLFTIAAASPRLGDWLVRRMTG